MALEHADNKVVRVLWLLGVCTQRKLAERRRKKRHRLLSKRTAKGQPVTKYAIQDMLSRIQAEKNNA